MSVPDDEIAQQTAEQHYYLSLTATKKYRVLRRAFWASSIGALCLTITAFVLR
jgi:hypothetical protein